MELRIAISGPISYVTYRPYKAKLDDKKNTNFTAKEIIGY